MMLISVVYAATEATHEAEAASGGVLQTLGINWKIFIAQIINFSVVVFIMYRYVYKNLLATMQKRTAKIEKGLADAQLYDEKVKKWDGQQQMARSKVKAEIIEMYKKAEGEVKLKKDELIVAAKDEAQKVLAQAKVELQEEKERALKETKTQAADIVAQAVSKILQEKIEGKKDEQLIKDHLAKIKI